MDDLDRQLIACLRQDARTPTTMLARTLKVSRATIQNRIDRLQASGILLGFTVRLKPEAEEQRVKAITSIEVAGARTGAVLKALQGLASVEAVHTTNGRWDLVAELGAPDLAAFSQTLDAIRNIEGISATETSLLLKTHRF